MAFWTAGAVGLLMAYLLGSVPTGYLAGKLLRGIDIRRHGSKSTGATNVLRTLGKGPALFVLVGDVLKAWVPSSSRVRSALGCTRKYPRRRQRLICRSGCHGLFVWLDL